MNKKELVRQFVNMIDESIDLVYGDDFYVDIPEEEITYTFKSYPETDELFSRFVKETFHEEINVFLISLLHEVGHIMTYSEEMHQERAFLYYALQLDYNPDEEEEFNMAYFNIPSEYAATEWGVNFYRNNREMCDNFIAELCK